MANSRDIKRKMLSIQSTQKITKAMKMVSAAKMRKSLAAMLAARPYSEKMTKLVQELARRMGNDTHPYITPRDEIKTIGIIIVTSDKGLCGAFNSNVIKAANAFIASRKGTNVKLYLVGKKAFDFFKRRDLQIADRWVDFAGKYDYIGATDVAVKATDAFDIADIDELHIAYNKYKSTSTQEVVMEQVLPVPLNLDNTAPEGMAESDFIYEPCKEDILDALLPKFINTTVFHAMVESSAGEHGARMVAMENATKAAGDMIKTLTLNYNKARQGAITTELLDIVNGAEALR